MNRWLARMRYRWCTKRLQKGFGISKNTLVRAVKNRINDAQKKADICLYPFVLSQQDSHQRHVLYNAFYCVFPKDKETGSRDDILREYGGWLSKVKSEYTLPESALNALKRENKVMVHIETALALNHFFLFYKFVYGGYMLSGGEDDTTITLIYYRTQPLPKNGGIIINPNLFYLLESIGDITSYSQIHNTWCVKVFKDISMLQLGVNTDISSIPFDKALYGTATYALKTSFFPSQIT